MADDFIFIVFGGTGDLAKRKLAPAFASLLDKKEISSKSILVGIARGDFSDSAYKKLIVDSSKSDKDKKILSKLDIRFFKGDASDPSSLSNLSTYLENLPVKNTKKIFYLATSFNLFTPIVSELKRQGLNSSSSIIFEKPFGSSGKSAKEIESFLSTAFKPEQIFRIDHYLAKETVQNIGTLKFSNIFFEPLLNKKFVESIEVIVKEDLGVGERLGYYNDSGAIKDMIQNHLVQVLSLVMMDRPEKSFHEKKISVLRSLSFDTSKPNVIGQYESYMKEAKAKGIPVSKTETFARLFFKSSSERWVGTEFILQTGKKLDKKEGKIIINFKQNNKIVIDIYPTQDVHIYFNTRSPESEKLEQAMFDFCHDCKFGPNTVDEYAVLISEATKGNHSLFPSSSEILESWRIIEQIDKSKIKFVSYKDGEKAGNIK